MNDKLDRAYLNLVWEKFKMGDREAFEIIYNEFVGSLYAYGSKITSSKDILEDSIQDLFIDIYKYGSKLRQPEYIEFYLFKSLKRNIIRKLKENKKYEYLDNFQENFNLKFSIEEEMERENTEKCLNLLREEIKNLNPPKRELIFLKFNSGLTNAEIGEMLDIKPDTVKKQMQRLLKYIRGKLN